MLCIFANWKLFIHCYAYLQTGNYLRIVGIHVFNLEIFIEIFNLEIFIEMFNLEIFIEIFSNSKLYGNLFSKKK